MSTSTQTETVVIEADVLRTLLNLVEQLNTVAEGSPMPDGGSVLTTSAHHAENVAAVTAAKQLLGIE